MLMLTSASVATVYLPGLLTRGALTLLATTASRHMRCASSTGMETVVSLDGPNIALRAI